MAVGILLLSSAGDKLAGVIEAANSFGGLSLKLAARTETLANALHAAREFLPEIFLLDASTTAINPLGICRQIHALHGDTKIVVLIVGPDDRKLIRALTCGASGILRAYPTASELLNCIETVLHNRIYIGPLRTDENPSRPARTSVASKGNALLEVLSEREIEVLRLLADGAKTREIAESLHISEKTVETHRSHIMQKLNIRSIAGLTKFAVQHGLTTLNDR